MRKRVNVLPNLRGTERILRPTLLTAAVSQLSTGVVVLLKSLLEVEDSQVVFSHGKVNTTQIVPEHTSNTFTWTKQVTLMRLFNQLTEKPEPAGGPDCSENSSSSHLSSSVQDVLRC